MAQVDHTIYLNQEVPDLVGGFFKGYSQGASMRQLADARKKEKAFNDAHNAGLVQNPDGSYSQDGNKTMSALVKSGYGKEAAEYGQQLKQQQAQQKKLQMEEQIQNFELIGRLTGSVRDQASYDRALQEAGKYGLDVSQFPKAYDPQLIRHYQGMALSAKEQLDNQYKQMGFEQDKLNKERDFGLKRQQLALDQEKVGIQRMEAKNKIKSGETMPLDVKKTVETLSSKNAGKIAIKNQIEAVMNGWDKLSDDQKIAAGRQLLKTLNSTEGADAIGVEEAQRLGSKLEFAMGNLFNSNPTQFGRDLKGFQQQANNTAKNIGTAVQANQAEIDRMLGRRPRENQSTQQVFKTNEIDWMD